MKRKIISLLLCCVMLAAMFAAIPVSAEETEGYYTYEIYADRAIITSVNQSIRGAVTIPSQLGGCSVAAVYNRAFKNCRNITSVVVPSGVFYIGNDAFSACSNLTSVTIADTVMQIGANAFARCPKLTSVTIPGSVLNIGSYAFYECSALSSVTLSDGVQTIGDYAFGACRSLTQITIPDSITQIGYNAFWNCYNLQYYTEDGVYFLGNRENTRLVLKSFENNSVDSYQVPVETKIVCDNAFGGCQNITEVSISASVVYIGNFAFHNCICLSAIWVDENNPSYCNDRDGILFNKDKTTLVRVPGDAVMGTYTVPSGVTKIGDGAFDTCWFITSVVIPDGVTQIGDSAFEWCGSLRTVSIPESVTKIGANTFYGCSNLQSVSIPANVTEIGDAVFGECSSLTGIWVDENNSAYSSDSRGVLFDKEKTVLHQAPGGISGAYTVPDSVTFIEFNAFNLCEDLTSVVIPASVTEVQSYAFGYCSSLESVTFQGDAPYFAYGAFGDTTTTAYYPQGNSTWTDNVLQQYEGTITWVAYEAVKAVDQWNVSLEDDMKVHFYLNPNLAKDTAVTVTVGSSICSNHIANLPEDNQGRAIVSVAISAAQMTDAITVQIGETDAAEYTVRQYCDEILADATKSRYHALVKEMLNYGAMAQMYFGHNTDNLANDGIAGVAAENVPENTEDLFVSDNIEGLNFYGASLVYRDKIAVRFYFSGDVSDMSFTTNGNSYSSVAKDGMHYIEIADILPQKLDEQITLTVTNAQGNVLTVTYGPMNYIVRMNEKGNDTLKALVKALYNYHLAAKAI